MAALAVEMKKIGLKMRHKMMIEYVHSMAQINKDIIDG